MMKAIVYTEYGPPEVLQLREVPTPTPQDNEVRIRVHATPVKYGDVMARRFAKISRSEFNMPLPLLPVVRMGFGFNKPKRTILGSEFAGEIEFTGKAVTRFKAGDRVYGYRGDKFGAYAEYLCMPEDGTLAIMPENMTYDEASCLPYGATMASSHLSKVSVQSGDRVLVNGASGGIGSVGLQLAKHLGAKVTGVCGTQRMDMVKALGADEVIDYTKEDFTRNDETYELIYDILGKSSYSRCKGSLSENGVYLLASFKVIDILQMLWTSLVGNKKVICAFASESAESLVAARELAEVGELKAVIDRVYPLEQAAEAHRYYESGQKRGEIVLTLMDNGNA
jgi:NADPH:quinone reductase-like Zn-dependent oxidoreductase